MTLLLENATSESGSSLLTEDISAVGIALPLVKNIFLAIIIF